MRQIRRKEEEEKYSSRQTSAPKPHSKFGSFGFERVKMDYSIVEWEAEAGACSEEEGEAKFLKHSSPGPIRMNLGPERAPESDGGGEVGDGLAFLLKLR